MNRRDDTADLDRSVITKAKKPLHAAAAMTLLFGAAPAAADAKTSSGSRDIFNACRRPLASIEGSLRPTSPG